MSMKSNAKTVVYGYEESLVETMANDIQNHLSANSSQKPTVVTEILKSIDDMINSDNVTMNKIWDMTENIGDMAQAAGMTDLSTAIDENFRKMHTNYQAIKGYPNVEQILKGSLQDMRNMVNDFPVMKNSETRSLANYVYEIDSMIQDPEKFEKYGKNVLVDVMRQTSNHLEKAGENSLSMLLDNTMLNFNNDAISRDELRENLSQIMRNVHDNMNLISPDAMNIVADLIDLTHMDNHSEISIAADNVIKNAREMSHREREAGLSDTASNATGIKAFADNHVDINSIHSLTKSVLDRTVDNLQIKLKPAVEIDMDR